MEYAELETFTSYVNTKFLMRCGDSCLDLELVEAVDVGSTARNRQFSLTFKGPENAPLRQGVYRLEHEKLGNLDLFLVPIGKDHTGVSYEAVFNRFVE